MKEFLCDWILSCVLSVQPVTPLPDLYYGTVLYDYYQDDYQQALLDALIVERRGVVGDDPVRCNWPKAASRSPTACSRWRSRRLRRSATAN